jgi:mannose-1-phosphate guanylyltransferase / mannose-6-phosphate isomerase
MSKPDAEKLTPVILCGGIGSRLWPLSRSQVPKQFMALASERTLLQETVLRVTKPDLYNAPIIVCGEEHRFLAAEQLRQIGVKAAALILEPTGRGTAPAIALAALKMIEGGEANLIAVMPADQVIPQDEALHAALVAATSAAQDGRIVTFGIKPTQPITGYGYITAGQQISTSARCFEIDRFIEKPEKQVAAALIESGRSYWNAGIFVGFPELFLAELETRRPEIVRVCRNAISNGEVDLDFFRPQADQFHDLLPISIDHAVMEHTTVGAVVPVDMVWSDIGSWMALWDLIDKDAAGNVVRGSVYALGTAGSYLRSEGPLLAAIGVEDLVVVADSDAVLVVRRDDAQRVKEMFDILKQSRRPEVDLHRTVYRPWGSYESVDSGDGFQVKRIVVKPHAKLSLQKHRHRAEHWIVVRGEALVTRGTAIFRLSANQSTYIPVGEVHRLENDRAEPLHLIEVQSGSYLGEDDIIRLDDSYGRKEKSASPHE